MRKISYLLCLILLPISWGANCKELPKIDMQKIMKRSKKEFERRLCKKAKLLECLKVTEEQCISNLPKITEVCSAKYLQNMPDVNSPQYGDKEIAESIRKGRIFGKCVVLDYIHYNGMTLSEVQSCVSRSNNALNSQPSAAGTPKSGAH